MGPSNLQMVQSASSLVPIEFYLTLPTSDIEIEIAETFHHKVCIKKIIWPPRLLPEAVVDGV